MLAVLVGLQLPLVARMLLFQLPAQLDVLLHQRFGTHAVSCAAGGRVQPRVGFEGVLQLAKDNNKGGKGLMLAKILMEFSIWRQIQVQMEKG